MKLLSLTVRGLKNPEFDSKYVFGRLNYNENNILTSDDVNSFINFVMLGGACPFDGCVEASISVQANELVLKRDLLSGVSSFSIFKNCAEGVQLVAMDTAAEAYLKNLFNGDIADFLNSFYINDKEFHLFVKDPSINAFNGIKDIVGVTTSALEGYNEINNQALDAGSKLKDLKDMQVKLIGQEDVENYADQLYQKQKQFRQIQKKISESKSKYIYAAIIEKTINQLKANNVILDRLNANKPLIERKRQEVKEYLEIKKLYPMILEVNSKKKEYKALEAELERIKSEIVWNEGEESNVKKQLQEKEIKYRENYSRTTRVDIAKDSQVKINQLKDANLVLNNELIELHKGYDQLELKKSNLKSKISDIAQNILNIKSSLDSLNIPSKSVGELLETVRVTVKIKEIETQLEKCNSDVLIRESQISEKQQSLINAEDKIKQVLNLDKAVTPLKAKDSYIKFFDKKAEKLEMVNLSLKIKQNNLVKAIEKLTFSQLELDSSIECLSSALLQKNYNRDKLLKQRGAIDEVIALKVGDTCPICSNPILFQPDISEVDTKYLDDDIEENKSDIFLRQKRKEEVEMQKAEMQGALKEVTRNIEINNSECSELRKESNKFLARSAEILNGKDNATMVQYFKAFESNNTIQFLMDLQREYVKSETELKESRKNIEQLKAKIYELTSRLNYLNETYNQLNKEDSSLELVVDTNEQIKTELADIGQRLTSSYATHQSLMDEQSDLEKQIQVVDSKIIFTKQQIANNEKELVNINEEIDKYADGDLSQAQEDISKDLEYLESEKYALLTNREQLENTVLNNRLLLQTKLIKVESLKNEYLLLKKNSKSILNDLGDKQSWVEKFLISGRTDVEDLQEKIEKYDTTLIEIEKENAMLNKQLNEKKHASENYKVIMANLNVLIEDSNNISAQISEIEANLKFVLSKHSDTTKYRVQLAQASNEYETLTKVQSMMEQTKVLEVVLKDKVKQFILDSDKALLKMTDNKFALAYDKDLVFYQNNNIVSFSTLDNTTKYIIYIALFINVPNNSTEPFETIVLGRSRDGIDKTLLMQSLDKLENKNFLVKSMDTAN